MSEEAIFRKLTADGGGAGDDKKFADLYRLLMRCMSSPELCTDELINRIIRGIDMTELQMKKLTIISEMNQKQIDSYAQLYTKIESDLQLAQLRIVEAKNDLMIAKEIRKNRLEYDAMAKRIEEHPSRRETNEKLALVNQDLNDQSERQKSLETKLSDRRNQLQSFGVILSNFHEFLKEDAKLAEREVVVVDVESPSAVDDDDVDMC